MLAETTSSEKSKQARKQDPAIDVVTEHAIDLLNAIVSADNPKRLRSNVKALVADYVKLNVVARGVSVFDIEEVPAIHSLTTWNNSEILDSMASSRQGVLNKKDTETIVNATKSLAFLHELLNDTPKENRGFLMKAMLDGFWALQKMQMCLNAITFSLDGTLTPSNNKSTHWLCLALRDYFNEWNTALMSHNPELDRRAREYELTQEAMNTKELERRLGL